MLLAFLLLAVHPFFKLAALQQPIVLWRPLNPYGLSHGVTYGTACPTYANSGSTPGAGELCVDLDAGLGGIPELQFFNGTSWAAVAGSGFATLDGANVFTGLNSFNRTAGGNDACFGATNAFCIDGDSSTLTPTAVPINLGALWDFANAVPAAGTGGSLAVITATLNAMDGADTVNVHNIVLTNADHAGAGNTLNGTNYAAITGDAQATENAVNIAGGFDRGIVIADVPGASLGGAAVLVADGDGITSAANLVLSSLQSDGQFVMADSSGNTVFSVASLNETSFRQAAALAVVGAAQNIDPTSNIIHIGAGAAASVATITSPLGDLNTWLTLVCDDANITLNDDDDPTAANAINLAGAATNFVCTVGDTITLLYETTGNTWREVSRSVN